MSIDTHPTTTSRPPHRAPVLTLHYGCSWCGKNFQVHAYGGAPADQNQKCPRCGSRKVQQKHSAMAGAQPASEPTMG